MHSQPPSSQAGPLPLLPPFRSPLVFFDFVTHFGGSNQVTVALCRQLKPHMPLVVIDAFAACPQYVAALRDQGTPVEVLQPRTKNVTIGGKTGPERFWRLAGAAPSMLAVAWRLRAVLRRLRPHAVWTNSGKALFVLARAVPAGMPIIWHIHGRYARPSMLQRRDWRKVSVAIGVSHASLDVLRQHGFRGRAEVLYNGIDIDAVFRQAGSDADRPSGSDDELRVAMPASLIPLKNHSLAIHGLAEYIRRGGRARLWVCGNNPDAANRSFVDDLMRLPERLGIGSQVEFLGWCENVPALLAQADATILTSTTEGLPVSLLESMCLGRPVVATRVGGIPELVRDGVDGFLVDVGDVHGVSDALARLADPACRAEMGRQAQLRIRSGFSIQQQAQAFAGLVDSLPRKELPAIGSADGDMGQVAGLPGASKGDGSS